MIQEVGIDMKIQSMIGRLASLTAGDSKTIEYVSPSNPELPERYLSCEKIKFSHIIINELVYENNLVAFILTTNKDGYVIKVNNNSLAVQFVKYAIFRMVLDTASPMMFSSDAEKESAGNLTIDTMSMLRDESEELYASRQIEELYTSAIASNKADNMKDMIDECTTVSDSLRKLNQ